MHSSHLGWLPLTPAIDLGADGEGVRDGDEILPCKQCVAAGEGSTSGAFVGALVVPAGNSGRKEAIARKNYPVESRGDSGHWL